MSTLRCSRIHVHDASCRSIAGSTPFCAEALTSSMHALGMRSWAPLRSRARRRLSRARYSASTSSAKRSSKLRVPTLVSFCCSAHAIAIAVSCSVVSFCIVGSFNIVLVPSGSVVEVVRASHLVVLDHRASTVVVVARELVLLAVVLQHPLDVLVGARVPLQRDGARLLRALVAVLVRDPSQPVPGAHAVAE